MHQTFKPTTEKKEPKSFLTPKGTKLPLMDIRGKEYLQVAHRIVWFREEHPTWQIVTKLVEHVTDYEKNSFYAIYRAHVIDDNSRVIATGTKMESVKGFADYLEKAETGAIGRALALCGYGTQFAPELEEGDRLADAPTKAAIKQAEEDYENQADEADAREQFTPRVAQPIG